MASRAPKNGDRVSILIQNPYARHVINGDKGTVESYDPLTRLVTLKIDRNGETISAMDDHISFLEDNNATGA